MPKTARSIRVGELLRQELGRILHTQFQKETVHITITEVDPAPDNKSALVYYSVIGGAGEQAAARAWFARFGRELQFLVAKRITLKYSPRLRFLPDDSIVRGNRILSILDDLQREEQARAARPANPGH